MQRINIIQQFVFKIGRGLLFIPFVIFVGIPSAILIRLFPSLRRKLQFFVRFSSIPVGEPRGEEFEFLRQVLRTVAKDPRPQTVLPLLEKNIDRLDETFAQQLQTWSTDAIASATPEDASDIAAIVVNLGNRLQELKRGDGYADLAVRAAHLKIAIESYQTALTVYTQSEFPQQWAMTQYNLGNALTETGDRERAIAAYQCSLEVFNQPEYAQQRQVVQRHLDRLAEEKQQAIAADSQVKMR